MNSCEKIIEDVLTENYGQFYRLAYGYVRNEEDALDIVQESAYKAIKEAEKLKNPAFAKTWIYRIVINTAISQLRKKRETVSLMRPPRSLSTHPMEMQICRKPFRD